MAFQVLPILRSLAPLVAQASNVAASLRSANAATKMEERVAKLEQQTIQAGEVLTGLAQQLQAVAEAVRVQAEQAEAAQAKVRILSIVSIASLTVATVAVAVAVWR